MINTKENETRILLILGVATAIMLFVLARIDLNLQTSQAPNGIVSFELAGSFTRTEAILNSWNTKAKLYAALSLGIDYLFLILYSTFLFFVLKKVSQNMLSYSQGVSKTGIYIALLQLLAGIFDAFENYFLLRLLFGSNCEGFSIAAFIFASSKFLIIILGLIYTITILILNKFKRTAPHNNPD